MNKKPRSNPSLDMEESFSLSAKGKSVNESPSSMSKTSKSDMRHRPNRPGWILKRANTISLCFSRDNQKSDQNSVYNLPNNEDLLPKTRILRRREKNGVEEENEHGDPMLDGKFNPGNCWQNQKDPLKSFCRGSLKKLRNAESKVIIAKKDVEDILIQNDKEPKEKFFDPKILRLEEDKVMLSEVQQEINHLISEFSSLVIEEEERIVNKAKILEKHNSCTEFKQVSFAKSRSEPSTEVVSSEDEDDSIQTIRIFSSEKKP